MKIKISNKQFSNIIIVLIIILLLLIAYNIIVFLNKPIYSKEIKVNFTVGEKIGLTIGSTSLDFGILMANTSSSRTVNLTNKYDFPLKVKVLVSPGIKGYFFSQNNFIIQPQETIQHTFSLILPTDAKKDNYSGVVRLDFFKAY